MTAKKIDPAALSAVVDAWSAICAVAQRRSLHAGQALLAGTPEQRAELERAFTVIGFPEVLRGGAILGSALRSVRGKKVPDGRYFDRSKAHLGFIWYIITPQKEGVATFAQ